MCSPADKHASLRSRLPGGLSRTLAAVAACPFTIVKTRMEYSGAGGCGSQLGRDPPGFVVCSQRLPAQRTRCFLLQGCLCLPCAPTACSPPFIRRRARVPRHAARAEQHLAA